jgi:hypothetical protein
MIGAVATHRFKIGIMYGGDPSLFITALGALLASTITFLLRRD